MEQKKPPTSRKKLQLAKFNEKGRRTGETAPGAAMSDRDVELMRVMHEEFPPGHPQHVGYRKLAKIFECSRTTVSNYCRYIKRASDL